MPEKLVYREGISSTLDAVRARITPRIWERLRTEAGIDEKLERPTYPIMALDQVVLVLADELFKGKGDRDAATYELGRVAMLRYGESTLGKALFPLVRLLGAMRFLKRMPALFRQTNNYADIKVEVTGPSSYLLDHNEVSAIPHYFRGVMQASGEIIQLKEHTCELQSYDGHRAVYRIGWKE